MVPSIPLWHMPIEIIPMKTRLEMRSPEHPESSRVLYKAMPQVVAGRRASGAGAVHDEKTNDSGEDRTMPRKKTCPSLMSSARMCHYGIYIYFAQRMAGTHSVYI